MTTTRGKQGNGSLVEIRPGVWRSRVVTGYVDGRAQQHSETYGGRSGKVTKREATARHATHVAAVGAGAVSTAAGTLGDYLVRWVDAGGSPPWDMTTARRNATIVRQLPTTLTAIRLRDLSRGDVQRYVNSLSAAHAPSGVRRIHAVLTGALAAAVDSEDEGLARNPASRVKLPVVDTSEAEVPEDDEVRKILGLAGLRGGLWADLYTFAAFTALRRGEVCGLRWVDVAPDLNTVQVRHSVATGTKVTGGTWQLKDTKTHQTRSVPLSQRARRAIIRRREAAGGRPSPAAYVFTEEEDGSRPIHPDHVSHVFANLADDAGLPDVKLKNLRSYALTIIAHAAGLKVAQQIAGHRDITTTARHYAGSRADATAAGLAALDAIGEPVAELTA